MDFSSQFRVPPGTSVNLADHDPENTDGIEGKAVAKALLQAGVEQLDKLQYLLYAENRRALLIVLQGLDASGKDGTIRHVMRGVNPQGTRVTSFKKPSTEELDHDYLWRIHKAVPRIGNIGIFNRSHYEDVLVVRVHELVPEDVWSARYDQINRFERNLAENDIVILKFFLHISKAQQKRRFQKRLDDRKRHWKISEADFAERRHWDDYSAAYEAALSRCSSEWAPWFIIPSDRKWFRNVAVSRIIVETLEGLDMKMPEPSIDVSKIVLE
jgi:PPK2 family polyphosphate:nucleotide phosphotransferase